MRNHRFYQVTHPAPHFISHILDPIHPVQYKLSIVDVLMANNVLLARRVPVQNRPGYAAYGVNPLLALLVPGDVDAAVPDSEVAADALSVVLNALLEMPTSMVILLVALLVGLSALLFRRLPARSTGPQQSEGFYHSIVDGLPLFVCCYKPGGEITFVNQTYCHYFQTPLEELVGKNFLTLVPAEQQQRIRENLAILTPESPVAVLEHQVIGPSGETRWHKWTNRARFDTAGQIVNYQAFGQDVTERRKLELQLSMINQAIENSINAFDIVDEQGTSLYVNKAFVEMWGYDSAEELVGTSSLPLYADPSMAPIVLSKLKESGNSTFEFQGKRKDGTIFDVLMYASRDYDPEGREIFIGTSIDVTERKRAEEALHQADQQREALINTIDGIVWEADAKTFAFTFVSAQAERLLGYPTHRWIEDPKFWMDHIHPEDRANAIHYCRSCTMQKVDHEFEYRMITADDRIVWLRDIVTVVMENDQPVKLRGIMVDITEYKEAQMQIEFQKTLLECQLEASLDGILIVSGEGEWVYFNQRFVEMWTIPPELAAAQHRKAALDYVKPLLDDPDAFLADLEHLRAHPVEINQKEIVLKDGRIFDCYSAPVVSDTGVHYGRLWSYRDITRSRQLEEQLRQAQRMEAIGRLAGGIAHDFNNILVPIIGYAELGMMKQSPDDALYTHLQRVRDAANRATDLTRQILAFSRKQMLEMQNLDLNAIVEDFEKMIHRLIGEDIELKTFLDPALYHVNADRGQLEQVLMNLVVNARDAMPTGGKLTIETANTYLDEAYAKKHADAQEPGHYVTLVVSDTGHGMDAQTRTQIFEPFFTTKEQGKGTGLGLSTVFGIIKQHNGNIWVYSEPGQGATFKIYLPRTEEPIQEPEAIAAGPVSMYGSETILVIEDEEMVRKLVCESLKAHGYRVIEARNTNECLALAADEEQIHLLLTDVIMPEMNGRDLYQQIAALHPEIEVLYMSGYTDNTIVHHGILDESINFLQKPFTVHSLTRRVRQTLGEGERSGCE